MHRLVLVFASIAIAVTVVAVGGDFIAELFTLRDALLGAGEDLDFISSGRIADLC